MRVLIRTDASIEIGSGHLMRCLTLADQLQAKGAEVVFACRSEYPAFFDIILARGYRFARLNSDHQEATQERDAEETVAAAASLFTGKFDWIVVDHYGLGSVWERAVNPLAGRMLAIDDLANRPHQCDALLDQNYYRDFVSRYDGLLPATCVKFLGPQYVLLRQEFEIARRQLRDRNGRIGRILVFFGGTDPTNETERVIAALSSVSTSDVAVDIVIGSGNPRKSHLQSVCSCHRNMTLHCQISNMAELIAASDLGIGAGGSGMWERCYLGLPTLTVVTADNQRRTTADVAETGAIEYLGEARQIDVAHYAEAIQELLANPEKVCRLSGDSLALIPRAGTPVADMMFGFH